LASHRSLLLFFLRFCFIFSSEEHKPHKKLKTNNIMRIGPQRRHIFILSALTWQIGESFCPLHHSSGGTLCADFRLQYSSSSEGVKDFFDRSGHQELTKRIQSVQRDILEEEWRRPPNASCSPENLVKEILTALWASDDPLPDSGFLLLLRTATNQWRRQILKSIGAPPNADWQIVSSALGAAIARPQNQFGLLVAGDEDNQEETPYSLHFPFEALDYDDGTAWIECQMRDKQTDELLVTTGWSLKRREDGPWLVDSITWHDLRDEFRPGIGQTEWMREVYR
jgi:hypothetical protein